VKVKNTNSNNVALQFTQFNFQYEKKHWPILYRNTANVSMRITTHFLEAYLTLELVTLLFLVAVIMPAWTDKIFPKYVDIMVI
jgi:hypothetical protein